MYYIGNPFNEIVPVTLKKSSAGQPVLCFTTSPYFQLYTSVRAFVCTTHRGEKTRVTLAILSKSTYQSFSVTSDYIDFYAHAFTLTSACVRGWGGREEGRRVEGVGSTGVVRSIRTSHRSIGAYVPSGESREITVRNTHRLYIDLKKKYSRLEDTSHARPIAVRINATS